MGAREELEKRIDKKRREIATLELQVRDARTYLKALEDTLEMMPRDRQPRDYVVSPLRPGSYITKAKEALSQAGKPLHIQDLMVALGKAPTADARAAVAGSLSAYVRRGEIFTRPGPNTFGLVEWEGREVEWGAHEATSSTRRDLDPPPGFGAEAK